MDPIIEEVRNSCGHLARYRVTVNPDFVDVDSEIQEGCDTCEKEDDEFKKHIAKRLNKYFGE